VDPCLPGCAARQLSVACVVPLRPDPDEAVTLDHQDHPDVVVGQEVERGQYGGVGRDRDDLARRLAEQLADRAVDSLHTYLRSFVVTFAVARTSRFR
jgi:hypothetical protein